MTEPTWEPMPGWYVELSDIARDDSGAPEEIRLSAAAAIQYVDDLRRDHKRLRAMEARAQQLAQLQSITVWACAQQAAGRYVLNGPPDA